jgi:ABC-type transport system involved in multi-copper enzyme maturation permease subunit
MSRFPKLLLLFGAILAVVGSFLPWVVAGDFVSYQHAGLAVRFDPLFLFYDNGGLLIVILSILVIGIALSRPFRRQKAAIMISALCLVAAVAYQWISFVVNKIGSASIIGAPEPLIGFGVIALGAIVVLIAAIWNSQNHSETMEL